MFGPFGHIQDGLDVVVVCCWSLRCVPEGELHWFAINFDVGYKVFKYSWVLSLKTKNRRVRELQQVVGAREEGRGRGGERQGSKVGREGGGRE